MNMEQQGVTSFPQAKDLRVLICDDDEAIVYYVKTMLEKHGCQVCGTAATGVESIQQFAALRPRVVLLDITMPLGKGLTILPVLQEIDDTAAIIMLTSDSRSESVQTSISLGAKGYITKQSLTPETLLFSICKAIGKPVSKPVPSGRGDDSGKKEPHRAHASKLEPPPDVDASMEPARVEEREEPFHGAADSQDENAVVLVDALPSIPRVYLTGSFHIGNRGYLHLYHPLTARREEGDVRIFAREVLQHPDYFFSFLLKTQGFQEIPALLYDQGLDGRIYE
jgi:DNA-binding NarL/FixJ family response regulator